LAGTNADCDSKCRTESLVLDPAPPPPPSQFWDSSDAIGKSSTAGKSATRMKSEERGPEKRVKHVNAGPFFFFRTGFWPLARPQGKPGAVPRSGFLIAHKTGWVFSGAKNPRSTNGFHLRRRGPGRVRANPRSPSARVPRSTKMPHVEPPLPSIIGPPSHRPARSPTRPGPPFPRSPRGAAHPTHEYSTNPLGNGIPDHLQLSRIFLRPAVILTETVGPSLPPPCPTSVARRISVSRAELPPPPPLGPGRPGWRGPGIDRGGGGKKLWWGPARQKNRNPPKSIEKRSPKPSYPDARASPNYGGRGPPV